MSITLLGIPNCDTCRKARRWLDARGVDYQWHDIRKDGLTKGQINRWLDGVGSGNLINRRGQTWRKLSPEDQERLDKGEASLFLEYPTVIKRPILERSRTITVGFKEDEWQARLENENRS